jgi:regulator of replication initiation timing
MVQRAELQEKKQRAEELLRQRVAKAFNQLDMNQYSDEQPGHRMEPDVGIFDGQLELDALKEELKLLKKEVIALRAENRILRCQITNLTLTAGTSIEPPALDSSKASNDHKAKSRRFLGFSVNSLFIFSKWQGKTQSACKSRIQKRSWWSLSRYPNTTLNPTLPAFVSIDRQTNNQNILSSQVEWDKILKIYHELLERDASSRQNVAELNQHNVILQRNNDELLQSLGRYCEQQRSSSTEPAVPLNVTVNRASCFCGVSGDEETWNDLQQNGDDLSELSAFPVTALAFTPIQRIDL